MIGDWIAAIVWTVCALFTGSLWLESLKDKPLDEPERTRASDRSSVIIIETRPGGRELRPYDWEVEGL